MKRNGMICVICMCIVMLAGCSGAGQQPADRTDTNGTEKETKQTAEIFAMNTIMNLTVYGEEASQMLKEARELIQTYENLLSVNVETSDVAKLNRAGGQPVQVSAETYELIQKSLDISKQTDGIFDISIYPLVRAWGFTEEEYRIPSEDERKQIAGIIDYRRIELKEDHTVVIPEPMQIDLGGIAKGYVSDKLMDLFREWGAEAAIVSLGGNVQTYGKKPDGTPFTVGITDPADGESMLGTIEVGQTAVITSGSYQRYFERDGVRYHHIMDKETGAPAESDLTSVTILCENGETADSIATAMFVMGKERAIAFDQEHHEISCILIDKKNEVWTSEGIDLKLI